MVEKHIDSHTKITEKTKNVLQGLFPMNRYKCWAKEVTEYCLATEENQIYWPSKMSLLLQLRKVGFSSWSFTWHLIHLLCWNAGIDEWAGKNSVHMYSGILLFWLSTIIMQMYSAERNEDTGIPTHWSRRLF